MQAKQSGVATLVSCPEIICIEVQGADAITFLQSQLTQDVQLLSQGRAALSGYCSPKGRLLATMILLPGPTAEDVRILIRADLAESFLKRIRMFVMRSKATFTVRDDLSILGLNWSADAVQADWPSLPDTVWQTITTEHGQITRAPSKNTDEARAWLVRPTDKPMAFEGQLEPADNQDWQAQDILAGLPWIAESTRDLFIPQSLNMDLIDGVSFSKGCYPGQEVVARAHYRTQVRRRMHAGQTLESNIELAPAADIVEKDASDRPVGRVIQTAQINQGAHAVVLFEAPLDKLDPEKLAVMNEDGAQAIELVALPYSTAAE